MLLDRPKLRTNLLLGKHYKPEMLIQRPVPGNVNEGSERDGWMSAFDRPRSHGVEQFPSESSPLVVREHAYLLNMGVSIRHINDDVPNWPIGFINGEPTASTECITIQYFH